MIAYKEAEEEVQCDIYIVGGNRREGQPSVKHYRACGETGHNIQTCQNIIKIIALTNSK